MFLAQLRKSHCLQPKSKLWAKIIRITPQISEKRCRASSFNLGKNTQER